LTSLANFDGEHYILIAKNNYSQYEQAYFPLYPVLIRGIGFLLGNNLLLSGILISSFSFFIGLFFFKNYIQEIVENTSKHVPTWRWAQLLLLAFPTAFYFTTVYTEGLFFLLIVATLFTLQKKKPGLAFTLAILASLTRLIGVFLFIPILFYLIQNFLSSHKTFSLGQFIKKNLQNIPLLLSPFIGLAAYCIYLWKTTGDPLLFLNAQPQFGAHRSSTFISLPQVLFRYLKIFVTAQKNFQYFISVLEFCVFLFVFVVLILELLKLIKNRKHVFYWQRLALNLFSFANILVPTATGTLSSIPRYSLMSLSMFVYLGELKNTTLKTTLLVVFVALHILLFGLFVQGYFVS
jgi:Gpi18-like mannosyltransferase